MEDIKSISNSLSIDEEVMKVLLDNSRKQLFLMSKYGIILIDIDNKNLDKFIYYISVPNKSEIKNDDGVEASGKIVASIYKEFIINNNKNIEEISNIDIVVKFIERDETWTVEKWKEATEKINQHIASNPLFPYPL